MLGVKTLRDNANRKTLAENLERPEAVGSKSKQATESSHSIPFSSLL